jgi:hypothetical protein
LVSSAAAGGRAAPAAFGGDSSASSALPVGVAFLLLAEPEAPAEGSVGLWGAFFGGGAFFAAGFLACSCSFAGEFFSEADGFVSFFFFAGDLVAVLALFEEESFFVASAARFLLEEAPLSVAVC